MSKLSFRARALDAAKPLPVYRNKDLPDLSDCVSINRAVPQMPTGMEKEEESEHHLQRAISAQQVFREKKESMVIPVPEAESNITYYDRLYKGEFKIPKQLIHIQPFSLDNEQPDYDMDSEDETLLNRLNRKMEIKPIQFETMVDRLEKASANQLVTLQEAKLLLNEDDYLLKSVYDYWVRKRKNCRGPSLIPQIKQEKRDGSTNNDPYVAFRRRTEKMQTRKNRKNDEASYEKMHPHHISIKDDSHFDFVRPRKKYPKKPKLDILHQQSHAEHQPAINKCDIKQYDFHSSGDEEYPQVQSPTSDPDEENDPDGPFAFRRKAGCLYHSPHLDQTNSLLWEHPELAGMEELRYRHCLTTLMVPRRCIGLSRRRIGRGGRVIMDRASSEHDHLLKQLDPEVFTSVSSCTASDYTNTSSWTNASKTRSGNASSLEEILSNIKMCRWRCFRPQSTQIKDSGDNGSTSKKLGQAVNNRRLTGASVALLNSCKNGISGGITEEQFQTHQQQLVQMQKQQLAQLQQKQQSQHSSLPEHQHAQVHCTSKTLDSARAHFAASAVVSAPGPARSEANKDNRTNSINVNGVVQTSGTSKTLHSTSTTLTTTPAISPVQLLRTVPKTTNHLIPALCTSTPQSLPGNNSCLATAVHLNNVSVVSPVNVHLSTRTSAPSPSALKLATVATNLDRVPKVTPSSAISSIARENHEPERLALNGISETTVAMEVT
ncbi:EPC2 protein, partial [Amia calva]|nr:EPC2 protein [Amia calva]